jgi:hypothetical protein
MATTNSGLFGLSPLTRNSLRIKALGSGDKGLTGSSLFSPTDHIGDKFPML